MTTATPEKAITDVNGGMEQADERTPERMVRELVSKAATLYNWLSGPPMTDQDRSRVILAEVSNEQCRRTLVI